MSRLRLRGQAVEKRYGRVAALRGLDFEIAPGEAVALLGANGAGKSSLLKILAGLSKPSHGRFEAFSDDDVLGRDGLRARVGYVGHATLLYGELSARENLAFAARLHGRRPEPNVLDSLLEDFALADVADRRAGTFSRGMAQRLSIARALVHSPSLLLLDEPFTGLDESSAASLSEHLVSLRREETAQERTVVVVTHDPGRAALLADRALLLHRGSLRAERARTDPSAWSAESLRAELAELAHEASAA